MALHVSRSGDRLSSAAQSRLSAARYTLPAGSHGLVMPRNRSEQDTSITLPPFPVLEGAAASISAIVRMDARAGVGPGESVDGDNIYTRLPFDEQEVYDNFDHGALEDHCEDWVAWYAKLETIITVRMNNDAQKQK